MAATAPPSSYEDDDDDEYDTRLVPVRPAGYRFPSADAEKVAALLRPTPFQAQCLRWTVIIAAAMCALVALVLFIIVAASDDIDLILRTYTLWRDGAVGTVASDPLPSPVRALHGDQNVALIFAFAAAFAAFAFALCWFLQNEQLREIARGSNIYVWLNFIISQVPLAIGVAFVAGISELTTLILYGSVIYALWVIVALGDVSNAHVYRFFMHRYGYAFSWAYLAFGVPLFLVWLGVTLAHIGHTYGGSPSGPDIYIVLPVLLFIFQILQVLVLVLNHFSVVFFASTIWRDIILYILNGLLCVSLPIVAAIVFSTDPFDT